MPTPEVWRENLERISRIAAGNNPNDVIESREPEETMNLQRALEEVMLASQELADELIGLLEITPEGQKRDAIAGFLAGVILSVIKKVADAEKDK